MEKLIQKYHAEPFRNDKENVPAKVPYYDHVYGVASVISSVFEITGECTEKQALENMINAALGHDLIEDTSVTEDEIVKVSNEETLNLIRELTNPVDDAHTEMYMEQLKEASEEARLVKYADLIENTSSVCYALNVLGLEWANGFYLPILNNTTKVLQQTEFTKYQQTAALLRNLLKVYTDLLNKKMEIFHY